MKAMAARDHGPLSARPGRERRTRAYRGAVAGVAVFALPLSACAAESGLRVQATVADDVAAIAVPVLIAPAVNLDAGFGAALGTSGAPYIAASLGLGSFSQVAEIAVAEGDRVRAGQPIARMDDRLLRAGLAAAESDAQAAAAQVDALAAAIGKTEDASQEIADSQAEVTDLLAELKDKRAEVKKAIKQLTKTRDDLKAKRSDARAKRAELVAARKQLQDALAALPDGAPNRPELEARLAALNEGIGQLDQALTKLDTGLAQLNKGLKQAKQGLTKLDDGIRKATDGLSDLAEAAEEVRDARAQLVRLHRLAEVAVETTAVGVELAQAQLDQATVTALHDGTVLTTAAAGDVLAPGATLVTIRRDGPSRLTTWLSPAQAATVCPGDVATVQADWGEDTPAELTRIASAAEFPPTSQATDEIHLTRAFAIELTATAALPAGTPVTVVLQPCTAEGEPHGTP